MEENNGFVPIRASINNVPNNENNSNTNNFSSVNQFNEHNNEFTNELRSVEEILPKYRSVFGSFPYFNIVQSRVIDTVLYTDDSVVVSAPTGSGKTAIFELAIIRLLTNLEVYQRNTPFKIVYVSPMKALCEERLVDWHSKFTPLGLTCICATGDNENVDLQSLLDHNIIITTPEKWDSLTRRWKENQKLVSLIKLFMIDEVHLLNESQRGPTLEAVVCRMKTIQESAPREDNGGGFAMKIRFIAASATAPNVEDIAEWLSCRQTAPARSFKFNEDMRPVKLRRVVVGYPYDRANSTPFKFDIMLSYKLQSIILQYAEGKPTLIFCNTRKSVEMTSKVLTQNLTITRDSERKEALYEAASKITDNKIKEALNHGVCYHHAGLLFDDRRIIEGLFRNAHLPILVTTSTLAMGVNLPAHLVVIKSTKYYSNGEFKDYSESMLFQMIGRAGRPQFDTSATAVILTTHMDKKKYEDMVGGGQYIESSLHTNLVEHLNAEVVLNTITDLGVAMQWLKSTFLYVCARKRPLHYGLLPGFTSGQIDNKLLDVCQIQINRLARAGMLTIDENDVTVTPTAAGSLMAKYCIAFETMDLFIKATGKEILQQLLEVICKCKEFSDIYLRVNEKKTLNLLNSCKNKDTIRFPFNGKIQSVDMKVNCIAQATFGCLDIGESALINESQKIMRTGERISKCLVEYLETKNNNAGYSALLNAIILSKCFHTHLWENSPYVSKQLPGIGRVLSSALVVAGKTTFKSLLDSNPRDIERIINRKPTMGNKIQEEISLLPEYELNLEELTTQDNLKIKVKVTLKNALLLECNPTVKVDAIMTLLIGDSENNILFYEKFRHNFLIANPEIHRTLELPTNYVLEINAHLISEDWVGFDCNIKLSPVAAQKREILNKVQVETVATVPVKIKSNHQRKESSHIQTFVDTYFKQSTKQIKRQIQQEPKLSSKSRPKYTENYPTNIVKTFPNLKTIPKVKEKTICNVVQNQSESVVEEQGSSNSCNVVQNNTESVVEEQGSNNSSNVVQNNTESVVEEQSSNNSDSSGKKSNEHVQDMLQNIINKCNKGSEKQQLPHTKTFSKFTITIPTNNKKTSNKIKFPLSPRNKKCRWKHSLNSHINRNLNSPPTAPKIFGEYTYIPKKKLKHELQEPDVKNVWEVMDHRPITKETTANNCSNSSINGQNSPAKILRWRSPLITSPIVKYSPNLHQNTTNTNVPLCENSQSSQPPMLKRKIFDSSRDFPASDRDYARFMVAQASNAPKKPTPNTEIEDDFVSSLLFQNLGVIQNEPGQESRSNSYSSSSQSSTKNKKVIEGKINLTESVADYWSQLVSNTAQVFPTPVKNLSPSLIVNSNPRSIVAENIYPTVEEQQQLMANQNVSDTSLFNFETDTSFLSQKFDPDKLSVLEGASPFDSILNRSTGNFVQDESILDFTIDPVVQTQPRVISGSNIQHRENEFEDVPLGFQRLEPTRNVFGQHQNFDYSNHSQQASTNFQMSNFPLRIPQYHNNYNEYSTRPQFETPPQFQHHHQSQPVYGSNFSERPHWRRTYNKYTANDNRRQLDGVYPQEYGRMPPRSYNNYYHPKDQFRPRHHYEQYPYTFVNPHPDAGLNYYQQASSYDPVYPVQFNNRSEMMGQYPEAFNHETVRGIPQPQQQRPPRNPQFDFTAVFQEPSDDEYY